MALPAILWRESFGYGLADFAQIYVQIGRSSNNAYGDIGALSGSGVSFNQFGRGQGSDRGWAFSGRLALRSSTLGYGGAVSSGIGLAFAYNQGGHLGNSILCEFWDDDGLGDGSFSKTILHLAIQTLPDGRLVAVNYNSAVGAPIILGSPSTYVLPVGAATSDVPWTWIEVKNVVISNSVGSVEVWADGTRVLNITGADTRNGGSGKIGYTQICTDDGSSIGARSVTDAIWTDGSNLMEDCRVSYFHANTAGTYTGGTGVTAVGDATLLACVDDYGSPGMDGDTTYINMTDAALPAAASFVTNALPLNAIEVIEVSPLIIRRKTDSGTCTDRFLFKSGATLLDGGADISTPTGFTRTSGVLPAPAYVQDPNTSATWTITNCNNVETGDRRTA